MTWGEQVGERGNTSSVRITEISDRSTELGYKPKYIKKLKKL